MLDDDKNDKQKTFKHKQLIYLAQEAQLLRTDCITHHVSLILVKCGKQHEKISFENGRK